MKPKPPKTVGDHEAIARKVFEAFGVTPHFCQSTKEIDEAEKALGASPREFYDVFHAHAQVWIRTSPLVTDNFLTDLWHEVGHAIVSTPERNAGTHWLTPADLTSPDFLSICRTIEHEATVASGIAMWLCGCRLWEVDRVLGICSEDLDMRRGVAFRSRFIDPGSLDIFDRYFPRIRDALDSAGVLQR